MASILTLLASKHVVTDEHGLSRAQSIQLILALWPGLQFSEGVDSGEYVAFRKYVNQEIDGAQYHTSRFASEDFDRLLRVVRFVKDHQSLIKRSMLEEMKKDFVNIEDRSLEESIELVARLWLTLNIRSPGYGVGTIQAQAGAIEWPEDTALFDIVSDQFRKSQKMAAAQKRHEYRIDPAFTAAYLVNVCGARIIWTDSLADHLKFDRKRRFVMVYQHKICLVNHMEHQKATSSAYIIPWAVLEEAVDTLNLLFPFGDRDTKALLSQEKKPFYGMGMCGRELVYDLSKYGYWKDQLTELIDFFNEPPQGWWQLVIDRRDKMQWATFWIAFLVLVLTVISITFGTVSTIYAIKQYNLALAQACSAPGAAASLPRFCI